jgi:hypothetical protein
MFGAEEAIMNICDNSLLRAEAFLNSADKAATRFHDAHISAQAEYHVAKLEWAREAVAGETWMQRCARIIPSRSQRKIDDVVAGRFPKIAQDTVALTPEEYEEGLKALAEAHGLPYRTLEEREAYAKELVEAMAAKRAAVGRSTGGQRNDCVDVTNTENVAAARKEAEAIRVSNGGAPAQQRTYAAPTPTPAEVEARAADNERDNLMILVISKLRPLSTADLNEVNELIDALTYPLRKPLQA